MRRCRGTDVPPRKSAVVGFTGQCPFLSPPATSPAWSRVPRVNYVICGASDIGQIAYVRGQRFVLDSRLIACRTQFPQAS